MYLFKNYLKIRSTQNLNEFIYTMSRFPIIKRLKKTNLYQFDSIKDHYILLLIGLNIFKFIAIFLGLLLINMFSSIFMSSFVNPDQMFNTAVFYGTGLLLMIFPFRKGKIYKGNFFNFQLINYYNLEINEVYRFNIVYQLIMDITQLLICYLLGGFLKYTPILPILFTFFLLRYIGIFIKIKPIKQHYQILLSVIFGAFQLLIISLVNQDMITFETYFKLFRIFLVLLSLFSIYYSLVKADFKANYYMNNQIDELLGSDQTTKKATQRAIQYGLSKKMTSKSYDRVHEDKKGLDYLHSIFLDRLTNHFKDSFKIRLIILGLIALFLIGSLLFAKITNRIGNYNGDLFGMILFSLYYFFMGNQLVEVFFFNCDHVLLRYPFFKERKNIFYLFKLRLKVILKYNLYLALATCSSILIIWLLLGASIISFGQIVLMVIMMSIVISVQNISLYYIFQPFDEHMNQKNIIYRVLNAIFILLIYSIRSINLSIEQWFYYIIGFGFIYLIVLIISVYYFAPKKFKLHES